MDWFRNDGWHFKTDPIGVVPVGFTSPLTGRVLGFAAPTGLEVKHLMVVVDTGGASYTTMQYITVLRQYLMSLDDLSFVQRFA